MALIIRIDVDRPYGKSPLYRHLLSRLSSDVYFPRIETFGYLKELKIVLHMLNSRGARAHVFFRRCTLPSKAILGLLNAGRHTIGLHLENSRSLENFKMEKEILEQHIGEKIFIFSKHGSGNVKYGYHHYAPYEPDEYVEWARRAHMKVFLGNLEDPSIRPIIDKEGLFFYPAAFWLETHWRNTRLFTVDWLISKAKIFDIVVLIHPENVIETPGLIDEFIRLVECLETKIVE